MSKDELKSRWLYESQHAFSHLHSTDEITSLDHILLADRIDDIKNRRAFSLPLTGCKKTDRIRINRIKLLGFEWFGELEFWAHKDV